MDSPEAGDVIRIHTTEAAHGNQIPAWSSELLVERKLLMSSSRVLKNMLVSCGGDELTVVESSSVMRPLLSIMQGIVPESLNAHTEPFSGWPTFKEVLGVADKYNMPTVTKTAESMLIASLLRRCVIGLGMSDLGANASLDWVLLCQQYNLKELGWIMAYSFGKTIANPECPSTVPPPATYLMALTDPGLLKTVLAGTLGSKSCM